MPQWLDKVKTGVAGDQKAIPDVPWLHNINEIATLRDPTATGQPPAPRRAPIGQREAHRHLQAYGGPQDAIDWVMDCVSLIAETAANADYHWEKESEILVAHSDPQNPNAKKTAPKPLVELIENPNPYQDYVELLELLIIDLLLVGNGYWLKYQMNAQGQPLSLYRLAPPYIRVIPGPYGVVGYEYRVPGQQEPLIFDPKEIVHFKRPNPHSAYLGLGVVQGGARAMDLELALTNTQAAYYENHARPSGVVQSERVVPRTTFQKIRQQLRGLHSGPDKAGELLVLEAGLKYQSISPNAVEAAFETLANASRDRICAMFRVPLALLGVFTNQNLKAADAQRIFDTKTMRPLLNKIQNCISYGLTQAWGLDFVVEYEYIMPAEDKLKLAQTFAALPGITVDEVRHYAGKAPHPDKTIGELTLNLPGENGMPGATRNGIPDKNLGNEPGRPPIPANTAAIPGNNGPLPPGAAARRPSERSAKALDPDAAIERLDAILADDFTVEGEAVEIKAAVELPSPPADAYNAPPDLFADKTETQVTAISAATKAEIIEAVHYLERGLLDAAEGKASGVRARVLASPAWAAFSKRLGDILERHGITAVNAAATHESARAGEPITVDAEAIAREVAYRPEGVRGIVANLRRSVSTRIQRAEQRNETPEGILGVVRDAMNGWRDGHAETVALSEAVETYNEGWLTAHEATGASTVYVTDGHDFDEACAEADGSIWPIEKARANRKGHPRCVRRFLALDEPAAAV